MGSLWEAKTKRQCVGGILLLALALKPAGADETPAAPPAVDRPATEPPVEPRPVTELTGGPTPANAPPRFSALNLFDLSKVLPQPRQLHPSIYQAPGISHTTMVTTPEGNVIIDTSLAQTARLHRRSLRRVSDKPVRYILLTHAHKDHTGGIDVWREQDTEVVAHQNCVEFLNYQSRLAEFFSRRNSAQFAVSLPAESAGGNFGAKIDATILFEDEYRFSLGGIDFHLMHAPGETYDHVSIWIPQFKAAFVGDNYYRSFPNLYSPRGTKPRWALDYVRSLNQVIQWEPEILVSGHSPPIVGKTTILEKLRRYRDAILYVHDATVRGMNDGKSVHTLMREIRLPKELKQNEQYGSVKWSVRGIYEGYAGWFDGNPSHMFERPVSETYPSLIAMAGGAQVVTEEAKKKLDAGETLAALHLADMVLVTDKVNRTALSIRRDALKQLLAKSSNAIESGWLLHGVRDASSRLKSLDESSATTTTRFTAAGE